jgi:drug/metabolite transporter (DMT)-like permease
MTPLSLGLVLLSALAHSTWNLLLKRSGEPEIFVWWLLVVEAVLMLPLGVVLFWLYPIAPVGWLFVLATIILHILYFILLGRGYAQGDLSVVYPIARGFGPMLVPILAVLLLGETIALPAILGIAAIVVGIYITSWTGELQRFLLRPWNIMRNAGARYAVLTGLTIAMYAIVDKKGVSHIQPFLYLYLMSLGSAVLLFPYIRRKWGIQAMRLTWRSSRTPILAAGLLAFLAYGLVLTAFSLSRVSYVAPAREVGIVVGVLMGVLILKEPFGRVRLAGSSVIVLGLILIAVSP